MTDNQTTEPSPEQIKACLPLLLDRARSNMLSDLKPWTCMNCPFQASTREPYNEIANDPSEAHYMCPVVSADVWGEDPECEPFMRSVLIASLELVGKATGLENG